MIIDIRGRDKVEVVEALYMSAKPQGLGLKHYTPGELSIEERSRLRIDLERNGVTYFDYLYGRVMKVDVGGDELDTRRYDRDNGEGAAAAALLARGLIEGF